MDRKTATVTSKDVRQVTPIWAVLLLTFLCSIGSAIVYAGVFFIAREQYGFGPVENFLLSLMYGVVYIPAAFGVGPALRFLAKRGISNRSVLSGLMLAMAGLCFVPYIADHMQSGSPDRSKLPIWITVGLYAPLTGALWPMVESYLAGGRSDTQLRSATGKFNICWSLAIVVTLLPLSSLLDAGLALSILNTLGVLHLACLVILTRFGRNPGAHEHHDHVVPTTYRQLLTFMRMLLPVSFMFISTVSPLLPFATERFGLSKHWGTILAAIWPATRVLAFFIFERWEGWHGRWSIPIAGLVLLLTSFAGLLVVPQIATGTAGLSLFILSLCGFGLGVGVIYAAALYYAMEVGTGGVDAGGMHETLIGIGYCAGPLCGLAGVGSATAGWVQEGSDIFVMLALVATIAVGVCALALYKAFHLSRQST